MYIALKIITGWVVYVIFQRVLLPVTFGLPYNTVKICEGNATKYIKIYTPINFCHTPFDVILQSHFFFYSLKSNYESEVNLIKNFM